MEKMDNNLQENTRAASFRVESNAASSFRESPSRENAEEDTNAKEKEKGNHKKETVQSVPFQKLFVFADFLDIILMIFGTIGAVGNGIAMPLMTFLFGQLINAFGQNTSNPALLVHKVSKVALQLVYVGIGAAVASFMEVDFWMATGERQATRIRSLYLQAILRQDVAFFDKETSTGEVIGRMSGDTILIQDAMGEKVGKFVQLISTFIGGFVVAFVRGWKLTLVMCATFPLLVIAGGTMAMLITKASSKGQEAYAQAGDIVEQVIGAIRTVVSFTGEKDAVEKYGTELKKAYRASIEQGLVTGMGLGLTMLVIFCTYALALWYGSKLIVNQGYSGGSVLSVIFSVLAGGMSLGQASPCLTAFAAGRAAAYKMFEVINRVPEIDVFNMKGLVLDSVKGDIELEDVDFAYPARPDIQIFSKFSLKIPRGITAALVGESGSGKSTVISLIERFYDPQDGRVLLDGVDIKQLQLKWFRQQIGLVSQEPVLFGTSIRDNIAYGKDGATLEEIQSAAELANAVNFIRKIPQGYDTLVGEHGTQLSGGQKQRIAIARAILKNPRVLLLDEATSALDAESEHLVQEALDRVMVERTTVVVAHRLTTIRNADLIAVVQRGLIVETGKHHELIERPNGAYSQLIHLQQMHQDSEDQDFKGADADEISLTAGDQVYVRRSSSRKSFRRSISRPSSMDGGRHSFTSRSNSARAADIDSEGQAYKRRKGLFSWFHSKDEADIEKGEKKPVAEVSLSRLAALNKPESHILFLGCLASVINGLIFPTFGLMLSNIIKTFFEPPHKLRKDANLWASMFVVIGSVALIVNPTSIFSFAVAGSRLIQRIRLLTFEKVVHQEIAWFDESENSSGAISARLSSDAAQVRSMVGDALSLVVQNIATIIAAIAISFSANWELALVVLAVVPLLGLQGLMQMRLLKGLSIDAKLNYEEASQVANDAVGSIRTVASFCAEDKVLSLYRERCQVPLKNGFRQGFISGSSLATANFVMFGTYGFCFWFGARLVNDGKATFNNVFRVFFAITMGALSVSQSTGLAPDLTKVKTATNSVFSLLDRRSKIDSFEDSGSTLESVTGNIEFKNVAFKYPSRPDVQIFRDLCLTVQAGKTVALVGESGSGKSTVIALLERFYDPDSGNILLDGIDTKKIRLKWLRQQMGLVSQEPILFNYSIRENIAYGKESYVTDEQIVAAAEASNAHKFISSLPDGYNTRVGERGIQLSGGQKQRVAIARAIIKNPKILLLDEATSALDAESEHIVQEALDQVMVNRSTIVIAHRLSTIKNADIIAVVKNGVIAEQGRHDELMNLREGAYASLVKLHMASS